MKRDAGADDLYVSTTGNDRWSGRLPNPNAARTDGPLATLEKARDVLRGRRRGGAWRGPCTVWLRGGRYFLDRPLVFGPEDSAPVTYAAYPGERPVLDGGCRIEGWRKERLRGREVWVADIPAVRDGTWYFRQLFVNDRRARRSRWPKVDRAPGQRNFLRIAGVPGLTIEEAGRRHGGQAAFELARGDMKDAEHPADVEAVVLHLWIDERMPVAEYDPATRVLRSTRRSVRPLRDDRAPRWAKYYLDNVFETLGEPGEWYLDRKAGRVTYVPRRGERIGQIEAYAPRLLHLLTIEGDPDNGRFVSDLRFVGLDFEHAEWEQPAVTPRRSGPGPDLPLASASQAASALSAALVLRGARCCAIEDCRVRHVGWYGIELGEGCTDNRMVGNELADLGGGGIKLAGADARGPAARRTGANRITDNHIHDGGEVFHAAVGILAMHAFANVIAHNHIHDLFYSGISCGWVWGYADNVSKDNRIEANHIHDLGFAWLSDMGGIYTLGVQPGTLIRGNVIHDIEQAVYGGWGIYLDEGSSHILVENNECWRLGCDPFNQHYGRENVVRNNIFAFGGQSVVSLSRGEAHNSFTLERNILLSNGEPFFIGGYGSDPARPEYVSDLNLLWDMSGRQRTKVGKLKAQKVRRGASWAAWRKGGRDRHSLVANPRFRNAKKGDFRLAPSSPAFRLGFRPLSREPAGPRPRGKRD
ncbi:MAG: right-handed parallel beta-helix repeat-containing protein [Kiritimatiellae bacterium]|nr:right-handed parallel beta-helix repeat-containing protein [Kiritimatiellia bacterium]